MKLWMRSRQKTEIFDISTRAGIKIIRLLNATYSSGNFHFTVYSPDIFTEGYIREVYRDIGSYNQ